MILWHYRYQLWTVKVPNCRTRFFGFRRDAERLMERYNSAKARREAK